MCVYVCVCVCVYVMCVHACMCACESVCVYVYVCVCVCVQRSPDIRVVLCSCSTKHMPVYFVPQKELLQAGMLELDTLFSLLSAPILYFLD